MNDQPAPAQSGQERERHGGFAGAGMRRGDNEAARFHFGCGGTHAAAREQLLADFHDLADHDNRRRLAFLFAGVGGELVERGDEDALLRRSGRGDNGCRRLGCETCGHQGIGDPLEMVHHHIEHDWRAGAGERCPVEILVGAMARREDHRAIDAAQRRRDRCRCQRRKAGGDAGDDTERNVGRSECERLFAAAPEHERIAALEPQHAPAFARERDQPLADVGLAG